jgi:type II secretory ATPase GspE/PulE/Tfp pilus assembly ATPase PilB-like protein
MITTAQTNTQSAMSTIRTKEDIKTLVPNWVDLSAPGKALALPDSMRKTVALIGSGSNKQCIVLVTREGYPSLNYFAACERAQKEGYVLIKQFAEKTVLGLLSSVKEQEEEQGVSHDHQSLFNRLMEEALDKGASDILLNQKDNHFESCFDVNTMITKGQDYSVDEVHGMMRHLYQNLADDDSVDDTVFKSHVSQVAAADSIWSGQLTRIRFQSKKSFPSGTDFALRLLRMSESGGFDRYEDLKLPRQQVLLIQRVMKKNTGATFFCGATSSGKTTSIKVALQKKAKDNPEMLIRSLEAPPEYIIKLIRQHAVRETKSGDLHVMADEVKEMMRMNPKYMFLGEVRGIETGTLCIDMLQSGHGLVSTLHTTGPFQAFDRLNSASIGVTKDVTTMPGNMNGLIYQRRLPTLCPHCSLTAKQAPSEQYASEVVSRLSLLNTDTESVRFINPDGCPECRYTGIGGSRVAMNAVQPDSMMLKAVLERDMEKFDYGWIQRCERSNWGDAVETDLYHALRLVNQGEISPVILEEEYSELDPTMLLEHCRTWTEKKGFACGF